MRKYRVPLPPAPTKNYKLTILPANQEIEVDVSKFPLGRKGLPGSILDIALANNEEAIEHACGGVQACSTCHIYVEKGLDSCNEPSDREEDYLEKARGIQLESRLACCCVPDGSEDIVIRVPNWNINEVKETPH
ncbi:MAG: 2Fe-2S ferredoxin [bacterium]|jgi:2Fe-2S ferredoxin